jgi:hypothetical protein
MVTEIGNYKFLEGVSHVVCRFILGKSLRDEYTDIAIVTFVKPRKLLSTLCHNRQQA